jgi:CDP-4-dehydro-6-deoxyglucose reductase
MATVLMALEKAGYALPNNCRAGACGECKVKVTSGQFDQGMVLDMALSQEERARAMA